MKTSRYPIVTENTSPNAPSLGEIEVVVELSESLIPAHDLPFTNILVLNVDSAYSLPPKWSIPVASEVFQYVLSVKVPLKPRSEHEIQFSKGNITFNSESQAEEQNSGD